MDELWPGEEAEERPGRREGSVVPRSQRKRLLQGGESADQHEVLLAVKYFQLCALENSL